MFAAFTTLFLSHISFTTLFISHISFTTLFISHISFTTLFISHISFTTLFISHISFTTLFISHVFHNIVYISYVCHDVDADTLNTLLFNCVLSFLSYHFIIDYEFFILYSLPICNTRELKLHILVLNKVYCIAYYTQSILVCYDSHICHIDNHITHLILDILLSPLWGDVRTEVNGKLHLNYQIESAIFTIIASTYSIK